ncbi:methyltransferase domain-containing protein [Haloechinothrix salitolerans]|uniref:Arsenite methyltransferase n=1 Tax=Haloechinothrix salitolerans TaxID=926830 RepID=A0ABW2C5M4_9PSEU
MTTAIDTQQLEAKVRRMYRDVAEHPDGSYHFETGRPLAERLGYDPTLLDQIPQAALDSFAGVGHFFDLAELTEGERVFDLGSGSGTDSFLAGTLVGPDGLVVGVDFTPEQLSKARRLASEAGVDDHVQFRHGRVDSLPAPDGGADCVISNGVINLIPDKAAVFHEVARVLRPGGRLAIADIVTERQLAAAIVCDVDLWASCIGGAAQESAYRQAIENAGLRIQRVHSNPYEFLSDGARGATTTYGVKSISLLATK